MNPGKLNKRITLVGSVPEKNEIGQTVFKEKAVKTIWAKVEPVRGREYYEAQKIRTDTLYKFTIRYRAGVTPDMQVQYKGRVFEIQNIINPFEENVKLEIMAWEKVHGK